MGHKRLDAKKEAARQLYNQGFALPRIASETGVNIETLKNWVYRGSKESAPWADMAKQEYSDRVLSFLQDDFASLDELFGMGINIIKRSLAQMEVDKVVLTQDNISKLTTVLDKLHGWTQAKNELDPLSNLDIEDDLKETLNEHPFFQLRQAKELIEDDKEVIERLKDCPREVDLDDRP